ncbi:hypothetical protein [Algiphilus sp.]|uniref:hypothetical protein n=1 Tax=Algiphilus sp. TaxID=1872431 RepID=UPI0025C2FE36|nr:hypothetical protein [Algiphilus sp.]MCK5768863.1 hypothetical protein [Algiphilus sp.]
MPRLLGLLLLCLVHAALPAQDAANGTMAVIVAASDTEARVDASRLNLIYRRKLQFWPNGRRIHPINLPAVHPLRQRFSSLVLNASTRALEEFWNERYFLGIHPPFVAPSTEAMIRIVTETSGAIGYIGTCAVDPRVRVVFRVPEDAPEPTCPDAPSTDG